MYSDELVSVSQKV